MSTIHIKLPEGAIAERGHVMLNRFGNPVCIDDAEQTFRGYTVIVKSGESPRHAGSSGRVTVLDGGRESTYYPSVISAQWVKTSDWQAGIYAPAVSDYHPERIGHETT